MITIQVVSKQHLKNKITLHKIRERGDFHISISLSIAKIRQWNGVLLYWEKIHSKNSVYT
jgi:hypothetical protein